jgi:hypothetical protein
MRAVSATSLLLAIVVVVSAARADGPPPKAGPDGDRIAVEAVPYVAVGTSGIRAGGDAEVHLERVVIGAFEDTNVLTFGPQQRGVAGFVGYRFRDEAHFTTDARLVLGQHWYQGVGGDGVHGGVDGTARFVGLRLVIEAHTDGFLRVSFGAMLFAGSDLGRREALQHYGVAPYDYIARGVIGEVDAGAGIRVGIDLGE